MNIFKDIKNTMIGDVAQLVERSLSMREVPRSMLGFSIYI